VKGVLGVKSSLLWLILNQNRDRVIMNMGAIFLVTTCTRQ
jgi:hypothetical protein